MTPQQPEHPQYCPHCGNSMGEDNPRPTMLVYQCEVCGYGEERYGDLRIITTEPRDTNLRKRES